MSYEIWSSLEARKTLQELEQNRSEIVSQIWERLNELAIEQENLITGSPERPELFTVENLVIIYRVWHRLQIVEILAIRTLM